MYHYNPETALEELNEEAALPNPVHMRDMMLDGHAAGIPDPAETRGTIVRMQIRDHAHRLDAINLFKIPDHPAE